MIVGFCGLELPSSTRIYEDTAGLRCYLRPWQQTAPRPSPLLRPRPLAGVFCFALASMTDERPEIPEPPERLRASTHRIRDRFSLREFRYKTAKFWFFLLIVVFVVAILIFGIPK